MDTMAGPAWITAALLLIYYGSMLNLLRVKRKLHQSYRARGERFDRYFGQDREMLAADRVQLNTLEHMTPFLAALWLHAFWVSPRSASWAGALYPVSRPASGHGEQPGARHSAPAALGDLHRLCGADLAHRRGDPLPAQQLKEAQLASPTMSKVKASSSPFRTAPQ